MKFPQVFGNFPSFLKSPFSARKRKRDQTEAADVQSLRPAKLAHGLPAEATALVSPATLQPVPRDLTSQPALRHAPDSHLVKPQAAELKHPGTNLLQHSAARSLPNLPSTRGHRPQPVYAPPAAAPYGSQRPSQPPQFPASILNDQLRRHLDQGAALQSSWEQLVKAKEQELADLKAQRPRQQAASLAQPAHQSWRGLRMAQTANFDLKERDRYSKMVAEENAISGVNKPLQRSTQDAGGRADSPIALDTPVRPGLQTNNPAQKFGAGLPRSPAPFHFRSRPFPSFNLQAGLQGAFSPAFRPANLAPSMPSQALARQQPGPNSVYRPAAARQQSVDSMKAAAELAERLQRHQPWQENDAVPAAASQKGTAWEAMQDILARSKALTASLSLVSQGAAVGQAEQQAAHLTSLRRFNQAVQQPAAALDLASPASGKPQIDQARHRVSPRGMAVQQRLRGQEQVDEAGPDEYAHSADSAAVSQSAEGYSNQSEEQLSAAFSELTSREGQLEPVPDASKAQLEARSKALAKGSEGEQLVEHKHSNVIITRRDIRTLASRAWLNDEVINVYMGLLQERDAKLRKLGDYPKCHFFNTFFINKLYKDDKKYNYKNVRRWTSKIRLDRWGQPSDSVLDCDKIIIPVHLGCHWICAVISLRERQILYFDSLGGKDRAVVESLATYVLDEYKDKRKEDLDTSEWERIYADCPQQDNGCDCGVFTLMFADYQSRDAPFTFDQRHMEYFRIKLIADIMTLKVDIPSKFGSEDSS